MSLCGPSPRALLASRVNRGCEGSNDCSDVEEFRCARLRGRYQRRPLTHSSTTVKQPVQERGS
jgi:hypothetical protein